MDLTEPGTYISPTVRTVRYQKRRTVVHLRVTMRRMVERGRLDRDRVERVAKWWAARVGRRFPNDVYNDLRIWTTDGAVEFDTAGYIVWQVDYWTDVQPKHRAVLAILGPTPALGIEVLA